MSGARARRCGRAALLALALATSPLACGAPPPRPRPAASSAPSWADVFDGTPDLYAVIRPQALKRDGLYGSFWRLLVRAAQARGFARGATMLEAASGADAIIVGLSRGADAVLVFRGVPAGLDPQGIADAEGRPLFHAADDRARVVEYELVDRPSADGSLFVLPDRNWVGALGAARARARRAFANPLRRPAPDADARALVTVRLGGPLARALDHHPDFGALSRRIITATFTLEAGKGGLVVALAYRDGAAAPAEAEARRILTVLAKEERYGWLSSATIERRGDTVIARLALPPRLLEELPEATGADVAF